MLTINQHLLTRTCTESSELAEVWDLVPEEAQGYAMTLTELMWYADKEHDLAIDEVLEGRFFWEGGEISWQATQQFTGKSHQRIHQVVLVYSSPLVDFIDYPKAKPSKVENQLLLYPSLIDKRAEGIEGAAPPMVRVRCWTDEADQPLYWQWTELVKPKEARL